MSLYDVWRKKGFAERKAWGSYDDWLAYQLDTEHTEPDFADEAEQEEVTHLRQRLALHTF